MEKITAGGREIEYHIRRGKRKKSIAISISSACQVVVLAPQVLSKENIREVVRKKSRWILKKQADFKKLRELYPEKEYVSGERLLFLGRKYRLKLLDAEDDSAPEPAIIGRRLLIKINKSLVLENRKKTIKEVLAKWYYSRASEILLQRAKRYSELLNLVPNKILVRNQQKRWGSCSRSGILRFNWRIALAPISIIDYVVVHEICHLKEKNHSGEFWKQVSLVVPDYKKRRQWLRDNSVGMDI